MTDKNNPDGSVVLDENKRPVQGAGALYTTTSPLL
jgi:hypothetical protein